MTEAELARSLLAPLFLILAYRRVLFEQLLPNVLVFFVPSALLHYFAMGGFRDVWEGVSQIVMAFALFAGLAYGAVAIERWYQKRTGADG